MGYINASSIDDVLDALTDNTGTTRIIAGATDLLLEMERGVRKDIDTLVDISRISGLDRISLDDNGFIHIGPNVTHNHCVGSKLIRERALPLALASWSVGSPQIRNRGTIAGNLVTASPANDTIPPLIALGAKLVLQSSKISREVGLSEFYKGVRKTDLKPDEMIVDIIFPAMKSSQRGIFIKQALRRAQAISVTNAALILTFKNNQISDCQICLGSVAPTIISAKNAQEYLVGKEFDHEVISQAALLASKDAAPISDIRGSLEYRNELVKLCVSKGLQILHEYKEDEQMPNDPVLLRGAKPFEGNYLSEQKKFTETAEINTTINGKKLSIKFDPQESLLRLLREGAHLTGTKEGCAEGECGACTVYLDGHSVMSCLVPAARAYGAEIITIEGIAKNGQLHPVQESFIEEGAVQCGYCTPGFIMSAAKLYEERKKPNVDEIKIAISGNLCRCTGYYSIVEAIEKAFQK